ncbi:MAG TPA: gamma-glutamyltransferase [Pyrinomonadaceae bacterium]|nr:gamma-glutamyltransferase [Pyrinomonadaceae bacterium]
MKPTRTFAKTTAALALAATLLLSFAPYHAPRAEASAAVASPAATFSAPAVVPAAVPSIARQPLRAARGVVASNSAVASRVGVEIMRRGGNAVDAAVAVGLALAVTYPEAGNLGGGGFMLVRLRDGRTAAIDYREMAPAAATRNMFVDARGQLIRGEGSSTVGYRASGVPGTVAGLDHALKKYGSGRFTWAQLVEPARRLAAEGFPVTYFVSKTLRDNAAKMEPYPETKRIYLRGGRLYREGETMRLPDLAATLARMKRHGPREFYEGETARLIAADMKRHGGLITEEDLRNYVVREREPVRSTYRGHELVMMPPPSSGGIAMAEMLNILEGYDLRRTGWSSSETLHLLAETMRRAFADRAAYLADADFAKVPVAGLIEKSYAERWRRTINSERASVSKDLRAGQPAGSEGRDTTHFSVVDAEGNVVANTTTINDLYGSKVTIRGTGVLMNDEMDDFTARPGTPNLWGAIQGEQNSVEPRKRPLSSMSPTIVLRKDGTVWFAVGARGGTRIITAVLQIIVNVIDYDMNIQEALDAPRVHHQWLPDKLLYERFAVTADTARGLERRGHKVEAAADPVHIAAANGVMIEEGTGVRLGASDPRSDGAPAGY